MQENSERRIVKYEKIIPSGLVLGKNKILENGKTVRINVIKQTIYGKGSPIPKIIYKIIERRR